MTTGPSEPGGFEEPPDGAEEDAQLAPPAEAEAEAEAAGVGPPTEPSLPEIPPALLDAKRGIEEQLEQRVGQYAAQEAREVEAQQDIANVQGVAIGFAEEGGAANRALAGEPGAPALTVYTAEPTPRDRVRSLLVQNMGIQ